MLVRATGTHIIVKSVDKSTREKPWQGFPQRVNHSSYAVTLIGRKNRYGPSEPARSSHSWSVTTPSSGCSPCGPPFPCEGLVWTMCPRAEEWEAKRLLDTITSRLGYCLVVCCATG